MDDPNGRKPMPSRGHSPASNARYGRTTPTGGGANGTRSAKSGNAKMGIKSGMTVEDLKRLTQQRMQQNPTASIASSHSPPPTNMARPTLNMSVVGANGINSAASMGTPTHALPPGVPKVGMSVQELKQLTSLRLASQQNAVLSNVQYHSTTPKRTSVPNVTSPPLRTYGHVHYAPNSSSSPPPPPPSHYMPENRMGMMQARHSIPGRMMKTDHLPPSNMYGYTYPNADQYNTYDPNQVIRQGMTTKIQESDVYPVLDLNDEKYESEEYNALQFPDDSFPPPPPLDEQGGFVSTSLPSWSPPPTRSKKIDTTLPSTTFYSQQPSTFLGRDEGGRDQNAIIAPPPGLSRRPSMTVPWQVAEAVLNTPQTNTISGRKTLLSPTTSNKKTLSETSNLFASSGPRLTRNESLGLKNPAAEVAAELSALTLSRQRSNGAMAASPGMNMLGATPPTSGNGNASARRGSFGNAAEFFKFRRRSKSRLELARDLSTSGGYISENSFPNYGSTGGSENGSCKNSTSRLMPGIDEGGADATTDVASDASDDDSEIAGGGSFVSFYNATGIGRRSRGDSLGGLSTLSIPPPPPPPLTDDEDEVESTTSSSKGLPMMSPNGFRLRKVAEMARRGSLSSEDKTRAKEEIIQHSLGIGASHAARILTAKPTTIPIAVPATSLAANSTPIPNDRPPMSPLTTMLPPPGFQRLQSASAAAATPPRSTPKVTSNKTLPAGIVRTSSVGITSRSPTKPILMSPNSAARKAMVPVTTNGNTDTLEARLADAAQRVADCLSKGDMTGFQSAMDDLDRLRNEASATLLRG